MADSDDSARIAPFGSSSGAFLAATLGTVSDSPRVDTLLERQIVLADITIDTMRKQDEYELSHLRFRRFSDQAKFALEASIALVVLLALTGFVTMVWNAELEHMRTPHG